ncbi:hypothetical protein A9W95_25610 [Mycobacterium sp. 1423905.2]|nr:hypothetical protein A9W95_25610 [Mycobacterium sp. 1423905.2]
MATWTRIHRWSTKEFRAECEQMHEPPAPGCVCGVHADLTLGDTCARAATWLANHRGDELAPLVVVGRVRVENAVKYLAPNFWVHQGLVNYGRFGELRGSTAQIVDLRLPSLVDSRLPPLAKMLATRYEVSVSVGL